MEIKYYILTGLIIISGLVGCADLADKDSIESAVVVKCILTENTVQELELIYTSSISENHYPPVEEAEAYIEYTNGGQVHRCNFAKKNDGVWDVAFTPQSGGIYKLVVKIPGYDTISATTVYPNYNVKLYSYAFNAPECASMKYAFYSDGRRNPNINDDSNIDIPPSGLVDGWYPSKRLHSMYPYFIYVSRRLDEYKFDQVWGYYMKNEFNVDPDGCAVWIYGMDYNPTTERFEQTDYIFSTYTVIDDYNLTNKKGKEIPEFKRGDYAIGIPDVLEYGIPMYHATTSTYYNISEERMYAYSLRLPVSNALNPYGNFYEPQYHQIIPNFKQYYNGIAHHKSHIVAELVNKDYDKYLKAITEFQLRSNKETESDELTSQYDYSKIPTNIINGLGVFGASNKSMRRWAMPEYIYYYPHDKSSVCIEYNNCNYLPSLTPYDDKFIIQGYYKELGL